MNNRWMNMSVLALSMSAITSTLYADDQVAQTEAQNTAVVSEASTPATGSTQEASSAPTTEVAAPESATAPANTGADQAATALQKKEGDATQETNLQEVFTSNERQYSLIKRGVISAYYDLDYTYYRDTRIDLALADDSSQLNRLRIEEDANHTLTNSFTVQYGLLDNLTFSATVPFVAKSEIVRDTTAAGLGDISFGARWEPFPLKQGRLPLVLFGNVSTKTGDSPYEIGLDELSTGKGYYSVGVGASTRKYIDPVVLFASASANYGFKETGLDQARGSGAKGPRILTSFDPGISGGFSFGFAYSFNYDVSLTMSYQQSFNMDAEFEFNNGDESYKSPDQSSAMLSFALGVRVSPETIVNGTVGIGLTEDAPDVSLGLSFPLDFIGFGKKSK
ncbi:putative pilus system protein FilC [Acinetobacter calcoaceticus]|uniref:putative pilus system protein FilC n=1 Tax=Acinetobacter calcoaceticus TaxID=471 RepID=UPI000551B111|nr:transporter [Acinetobacter calcoaceticus]